MSFTKITSTDLQNKGVIGLADTPGLDTSHMQQKFDEIALDVIVPKFNNLIDELEDAGYDPSTGDVMHKATYDSDNDGKVDSAEDSDTVNGHTVESDVPDDAVFTDTTYTAGTNVSISDENVISATVPTKTSDLVNDSGFITNGDIPTKTSDLTNDSGFITASDIPAIPSKTSDLTNDSGFITSSAVPTKTSQLTNDSGFITASSVPSDIDDLSDVSISSPSNGQVLGYNSSTQKWENTNAGTGTGDMQKSVYDDDDTVENAGGIKDYVTSATSGKVDKSDFASEFDPSEVYIGGEFVYYNGDLYRCKQSGHTGAWNANDFFALKMADAVEANTNNVMGCARKVSGATPGNFAGLDSNGNLTDSGHKHSDYLTSLPIASANDLGGIKVGTNLSIDANGVLSADTQGDMSASVYDSTSAVANAGGIVAYIDDTITAALTASY